MLTLNQPTRRPRAGGHHNQATQSEFHDAVSATEATGVIKAAGGFQAATGLLLAFSGTQLKLAGLTGNPWVMKVPWLMIVLGLTTVFFAVKIFKTRGWAAIGGTVLNGVILVAMGVWVLLTLVSGFFSPMASLVPMAALAGAVLGAIAIGPCLRASEARRKLQEAGIDMSF